MNHVQNTSQPECPHLQLYDHHRSIAHGILHVAEYDQNFQSDVVPDRYVRLI
ncbi:hypothetical protein D3C72_2522980 [compost metagenome]